MMNKKIEVLAPAGGMEQLVAAVRCGADAVYLGTDGFNARQNAHNFNAEELFKAVEYCTQRNVAVHVTLNTLIFDDETEKLKQYVKLIAQGGADAVIVQDLATARIIRECCPDMPMHASTQMTVHNYEGVKAVQRLGFSRAVLARELTFDEIQKITQKSDIETEVFVHGALCTCVSGACYLSAMLGGRSGNRGCCAQPCRLNFTNGYGREYAISLKDMSHVLKLQQLKETGVASLKIEGRMKRPEYVAAAVTAVRAAIDGKTPDMDTLKNVFSRDGFTDGYFTGKRNVSMYGTRKKEDAMLSSKVYGEIASLYRAERQNVPVSAEISIKKDKPCVLTVTDGEHYVTVEGDIPQEAMNRRLTEDDIARSLQKTGGTPFYIEDMRCFVSDDVMLPNSELNLLRRNALDKLLTERCVTKKHFEDNDIRVRPHIANAAIERRLRFENFTYAEKHSGIKCDKLIIPIAEILKKKSISQNLRSKLIAELPSIAWESDIEDIKAALLKLKDMGVMHAMCSNIGTADMALKMGFTVHGGMELNIINSIAIDEYAKMGLEDVTVSFEAGANKIRSLGGKLQRGIVVYGYLPLMKLRNCPARGKVGCADCDGRPHLTDAKGVKFNLLCRNKKYTELFNSVPLYVADKKISNVDFETLYFTFESEKTITDVLTAYDKGILPDFNYTRGLYFRNIN